MPERPLPVQPPVTSLAVPPGPLRAQSFPSHFSSGPSAVAPIPGPHSPTAAATQAQSSSPTNGGM